VRRKGGSGDRGERRKGERGGRKKRTSIYSPFNPFFSDGRGKEWKGEEGEFGNLNPKEYVLWAEYTRRRGAKKRGREEGGEAIALLGYGCL